jgi:hypothetical protein
VRDAFAKIAGLIGSLVRCFVSSLIIIFTAFVVLTFILVSPLRRPATKRFFSFLGRQPILSIISLVVSVLSLLTIYVANFWRPEHLEVYFRFKDPSQVGTSALDLSYFITNDGSKSYTLEDVRVYEIWSKSSQPISQLHSPPNELAICEDTSILPLNSLVLAMTPPLRLGQYQRWLSETYIKRKRTHENGIC